MGDDAGMDWDLNASGVGTLAIAIAAFCLSVYNTWKAGRGAHKAYEIDIVHLEGSTFRMTNTGRRRLLADVVYLDPLASGRVDLPKIIELDRRESVDFSLKMTHPDAPYPRQLMLRVKNVRLTRIDAPIPYSAEVRKAPTLTQPPKLWPEVLPGSEQQPD